MLYVDDDEALVRLAQRLLGRMGYEVTGMTIAERALQEFRQRPNDFGLVVTDLSMAGMSGFELADELLKVRSDMPVIITTGYVRPEDEQRAQRAGIVRILPKPGSMQELSQAIDTIFREIQAGP